MKILHLIRSMRREGGGPAEGVRVLTDVYRQLGHSVEIATLDPPGEAAADLDVPVHALGRRSSGYGYSPHLRPWLRDNASRFDGTIVDGLWQYHGLAALRELRGRFPYAVFPHGMLDPWFNRTYPWKLLKKVPYWALVEGPMLRGSRAVLFTCVTERELAPRSFSNSVWNSVVVPYGTLGPPGDAADEIDAFHRALPQLKDKPFLLFAGRLHPKKGCDLLLRAYAAVAAKHALPTLVFAGPDSVGLQAKLMRLAQDLRIADRVVWAGMVVGPAKWGAFRAAEALILPSHQENFGIVVAEALSCGTPVLISDQVNIAQEVLQCGAGFVEQDTVPGTERLLQRWVALDDLGREQMREKALACWQGTFNSLRTGACIADLFRSAGA
ncbi:glycosyltransferase [Terriglobus aquaticus]|uniref:Glycosyltransferase n=1 Tax=Terriglobus aquaticus TaxID=940139 RepID=A0ABW9KNJ2_9BACT|nr:glycosyltransferase [Terriglobus aquaticus]